MLGEFQGFFYGVHAKIIEVKYQVKHQICGFSILQYHHKKCSVLASQPGGNGPGENK